MNALNTLIAKNGIKLLTKTNQAVKIKFSSFVPSEDCIVSSLLDKHGNNIISKVTDDPTKEFLPILFSAPDGASFYGVTFSQGKIALVLEPYIQEEL